MSNARASFELPPWDRAALDYMRGKANVEGTMGVMLIEGKGQQVVQKVLDIALEDGHPGQMAALKLCMERALPVSMFEKTAAQRAAVTINITGICCRSVYI